MNNQKGFTLVELIAVITIIAMVSILSFTSLTNMLKETDERELEAFETSVKTAASVYVETNLDKFPGLISENKLDIKCTELIDSGYLSAKINNPTAYSFNKITVHVIREDDQTLSYSVIYG